MHRILRLSLLVALAAGLPYAACKKKVEVPTVAAEETNPKTLFNQGVTILSTPDKTGLISYETAFEAFERSASNGGGAKAEFNAGWVAEVLGKPEVAEQHYRKAYEADSNYEAAMFSLAKVLAEQKRGADAVALYKDFLAKHPDRNDVRNDLISTLGSAGNFDEAIAQAQEVLRVNPKDASVYRSLSAMYFAQGKYGLSQLCNEKALQLNEGDAGTYNNMGVTHYLQKDLPRAIDKFKTAIKLDRANFESNANLGFIALDSGDYTLAKGCFEAAVAADPTNVEAKLGLAVALRGTGDTEKAGLLYDEIIKADPKNRLAYFNAATMQEMYVHNYKKALKLLQDYVDSAKGTIGPNDEAFARMERVKATEAAEEAARAVEELKKKQEEERKKRNEELLNGLKTVMTELGQKVGANSKCIDPAVQEEAAMVIEQGQAVVEAQDVDSAPDLKTFLDGTMATVDDAIAACGGAAAPAPAPEGTAAPAEGTAPAETPPPNP